MAGALNDDQREWIKQEWVRGASAGEIARALGANITRNMVIGVIHRAGLSRGPGASIIRLPKPAAVRLPKPAPAPKVEAPQIQADPALVRTLLEADKEHCRWPVTLPDDQRFLYCGRTPRAGSPFCEGHAAQAYQVQQSKKKDRAK